MFEAKKCFKKIQFKKNEGSPQLLTNTLAIRHFFQKTNTSTGSDAGIFIK